MSRCYTRNLEENALQRCPYWSILGPIWAKMKTSIWTLRILLIDVHIRRGLIMIDETGQTDRPRLAFIICFGTLIGQFVHNLYPTLEFVTTMQAYDIYIRERAVAEKPAVWMKFQRR
jgi:hypothetical protein